MIIMKTGLKKLDEAINMEGNTLIILGGTANVGKTSLVSNIVSNVAIEDEKPVLWFSLECSKETIISKVMSCMGMIEYSKLVNMDFSKEDINEIKQKIEKAPIYIDDTPAISISEICEKSQNMTLENNISLIVIDYLQLISYDKKEKLSRSVEINKILDRLKTLSKELNIPILLTSYISNNKIYRRENYIPTLEDLTSNNIDYEKYADIILLLHREECFDKSTKKKDVADIIIAKNTTGIKKNIELGWMPKNLKFYNL